MFTKHKASFSIRMVNTWSFKPVYRRFANAGNIRFGIIEVQFPLPYLENFIYSQGYDAGFRAAKGIKD